MVISATNVTDDVSLGDSSLGMNRRKAMPFTTMKNLIKIGQDALTGVRPEDG